MGHGMMRLAPASTAGHAPASTAERAESDSPGDPACKNQCVRPAQTHGIQTMREAQREATKMVQQAGQDQVPERKSEQVETSKEVEDDEKRVRGMRGHPRPGAPDRVTQRMELTAHTERIQAKGEKGAVGWELRAFS